MQSRFIATMGRNLGKNLGKNLGRTLACAAVVASLVGCEADSWMDPSRTGYFETTPTTMPILSRLDVVERASFRGAHISPPTGEDLAPGELKYRLAPGDEVRVEVYELIAPNETEVLERIVDQTGNIRIKEVGDVVAAGLTIEELQKEVESKVSRLVTSPIVGVSLLRGQGFQFAISGSVQTVGVFGLNRPDFRLSEAIALAGGTLPTTQRVTVIRSAPLADALNPVYPEPEAGRGAARGINDGTNDGTGKPATPKPVDINELIEQLDGGAKPATPAAAPAPDAAVPTPAPAPGMVRDTRAVLAQNEPPAIDIDELTAPKVQDAAMLDANAAAARAVETAAGGTNGATPASGWVFDTTTGRWARGGAPSAGTQAGRAARTPDSMYTTRIIEVDYQALVKGDPNLNVVIRPGDQIYVEPPETGFIYIDGEINRIGVYELQNSNGRLTLSRFVSAAGGLAPTAIPNRVDLVRVIGKDREATIRVDLAAIRNRSEPDIYMRPDDHVIIGTNFFATPLAVIRNGFRMTYGFGFLLDRNFGNDVFGPPPEFVQVSPFP
jgi:polysaccharide export outer membrane protein